MKSLRWRLATGAVTVRVSVVCVCAMRCGWRARNRCNAKNSYLNATKYVLSRLNAETLRSHSKWEWYERNFRRWRRFHAAHNFVRIQ